MLLIWNPSSGRPRWNRRRRLLEAFARHGVQVELREFDHGRLAEWIEEAKQKGFQSIVAAGGDGTVNAVATEASRADLPMGVIPLGTFNHFAKDLRIPLDLQDAVDSLFEGQLVHVDMGEVNGRRFLNNSSIGLYPLLVKIREQERKLRKAGKLFATLEAFWKVLVRFRLRRVRIKSGNVSIVSRTPFVFVGNNFYDLTLMHFGRRRTLNQGKLTLYLARCRTRRSVLRLAMRIVSNGLSQDRDFQSLEVEEVEVLTRRERLMVSLDGEVEILTSPLRYKSVPAALPVLLPKSSPLAD